MVTSGKDDGMFQAAEDVERWCRSLVVRVPKASAVVAAQAGELKGGLVGEVFGRNVCENEQSSMDKFRNIIDHTHTKCSMSAKNKRKDLCILVPMQGHQEAMVVGKREVSTKNRINSKKTTL